MYSHAIVAIELSRRSTFTRRQRAGIVEGGIRGRSQQKWREEPGGGVNRSGGGARGRSQQQWREEPGGGVNNSGGRSQGVGSSTQGAGGGVNHTSSRKSGDQLHVEEHKNNTDTHCLLEPGSRPPRKLLASYTGSAFREDGLGTMEHSAWTYDVDVWYVG